MILVTIITPTYEKFNNTKRTIQSVLSQDYPRIEYIITDDGSSNCPYEEIERYVSNNKESNIENFIFLKNSTNEGTVKNMNSALKKANGNIIMPLAGDDVFFDVDVVSKVVNEFENRGCDTLVVSRYCEDADGRFRGYLPHIKDRKAICRWDKEAQHNHFLTCTYKNMASGSCLYYRREFIEKIGLYDENYILWEDGPFIHKTTKIKALEFAYNIVGIKYRTDGISNNVNQILFNDGLKYNSTELVEDIERKSWITKEFIRCRVAKNQKNIIYLLLRYPIVVFIIFLNYASDAFYKLIKQ